MILRFLTRVLIALGCRHSIECDGQLHRIETQFGTREICTGCEYTAFINDDVGEG